MTVVSNQEIRNLLGEKIFISPFNEKHLNTSSYDVTLGKYYYIEKSNRNSSSAIYNPYSKTQVNNVWGADNSFKTAMPFGELNKLMKHDVSLFENIGNDDLVILIEPGETILAHTNEFIGGIKNITTMMKSRSSIGRNFLGVCRCAGWGDVGYCNRWTMEIMNMSRYYTIPLVVGRRIAQIIFFKTDQIEDGSSYEQTGKYQQENDFARLKGSWEPSMMLPKMYNDKEITSNKNG